MMDPIELEIGGGWIGSAYSPQVSVTETEDGHRVEFTYDDAEDGVSTVGYDIPDWSDDEEARSSAEAARAAAEAQRASAEAQRAAAESSRSNAETARASAESARASAESSRSQAESGRASAEAARASAESARASAESSRSQAETARATAEAERASAETARSSAESARATAEAARASAESQRAAAETARESASASAVSAANSSASNANSAASEANAATSTASSAAQAASTAAQAANDAAERAEDAIEAIGDISELAVPLMSADTRGGAKLGRGLMLEDGALSLGDIVTDETNGPIYSAYGEGHAEQATTVGKNLIPFPYHESSSTKSGVTFTVNDDGSVTATGTATARVEFQLIGQNSLQVPNGTYTVSYDGLGNGVHFLISGGGNNGFPYQDKVTDGSATGAVTDGTKTFNYAMIRVDSGATVDTVVHAQLEAGSTATSYEPYTGGKPSPSPDYPQAIEVVRGRNLLELPTWAELQNCELTNGYRNYPIAVKPNTDYYLSTTYDSTGTATHGGYVFVSHNKTNTPWKSIAHTSQGAVDGVITIGDEGIIYVNANLSQSQYEYILAHAMPQLELGTTPTPYVPYGHVGLEVHNSNDELVSVTPIPLPEKGFAASLPDGTADVLNVDSAGGYEWESVSDELTLNGSESWGADSHGFYNAENTIKRSTDYTNSLVCSHYSAYGKHNAATKPDYGITAYGETEAVNGGMNWLYVRNADISTASDLRTWLASNPMTVIFPLATPTTESGYIDLPDIPDGATVDIPELHNTAIRCFVPGARELAEHAANWGHRALEMESRIAALEAAIATLATQ